jgi:dienelactone hydrolase
MRRRGIVLVFLSVLLGAAGNSTARVAFADEPGPRFVITPARVLHDREVSIQLHGLKPGQKVTVRGTRGRGKSEIDFVADANGKVDVSSSNAKPGEKVAPVRVLWSMTLDPEAKVEKAASRGQLDPYTVSLTALVDGKEIAAGNFEMIYLSPVVERIPVKDGKLRGVFFRPKAKGKYPGVLFLGGSEGGVWESTAALLAAHGYAVLNLAYFKYDDLPEELAEIPLEYFEEGLGWMEKQECVAPRRLAVMGVSRGGELALLLGTRFPKIKAVVAYVPSHVVGSAFTLEPKASWTYQGKPIYGLGSERRKAVEANPGTSALRWREALKDPEAVKKAAIPVEKINGPVLVISGKCDHVWPSSEMSEEVVKRLREHKHPHAFGHLPYDDAGHYIGIPNRAIRPARDPKAPELKFGDTAQGNAYASWDSWNRTLRFLEINLILRYTRAVPDEKFDTTVAKPAYTANHPKVLFDEAHNNYHTADGLYKVFADLITNDGYRITVNKQKFEKKTLDGFDILVIANAASAKGHARSVTDPAFTKEECDAVYEWVRGGGNLLLIADHAPYGAAAEMLANRFGVDMSKGGTIDTVHSVKDKGGNEGWLVFTRENKLLGDHAITKGRTDAEKVKHVVSFAGQSLKGPEGSVVLLQLADSAQDVYRPGAPEPVSAKGRAQGVAFACGKGRVVVLGEAAMLSARITMLDGKERYKVGMNRPGTDNRQFALNLMHWLSRLTD